ncbi:hypothetical protein C6I20_05355 [Aeromicrobium sp. A1-2]|uniref:RDD family protein n=1 Tax=Aeromicrobium sp. A1-2 TaxID=2107713 RepID=UPI000E50F540|nr:RDD family protein [Aeromicrobium sp. A1-2]AXT84674.1 hypothetical protein C6I20_05355 [Aeromicrobium sp. A1-2]
MQTVSLGRRFGALFIDWIIAVLTAAAITGTSYAGSGASGSFVPLAAFFVETTLLVGLLGTTIGKRIFGMRVEGPDGRSIGLLRAAVRTALLCLVIPAIVMTEDKRGLHEIASRSRVTRF